MNSRRIETTADLAATIDRLVGEWCDRRSLVSLRYILAAWPSPLRLTDDWGELRSALRNVLGLGRADLTAEELEDVEEAIASIDVAMDRTS